ncbi:hypothetical protein RHMOL_Rhmol03G0192300 [Rhododendron molle]|uniref:Uncharacterized protein n=1 Tax=Rhododendron molle TaxID=49168 RepID=A0ACC0PFX1_RHOML|nr:hypothetical protein RHMOL_Rhmol03G0192300 [Rhododendron molle]
MKKLTTGAGLTINGSITPGGLFEGLTNTGSITPGSLKNTGSITPNSWGPMEHWECNPWGPNPHREHNFWGPVRWPEEHWEHNPCGPNQHRKHFADVSDPFFSTKTSLSERLKMMDKFMDSPYPHATTYRGILPGRWEARATDDGFYIRMYMAGLAKENVYITGKHNYMSISTEVSSNDDRAWRISTTIDLPLKFYKSDQIKAEMKNGVLNIVVLKSEKEERDEEFHVNVE